MSRDEWVRGLRASPRRYKRLLEPLFDFPQGNFGYSAEKRHTKPYNLKPHVSNAARAVFEGDVPLPVRCRDTDCIVTRDTLPANGLPEYIVLPFAVPSVMALSRDDVDRATETVQRWKETIYGYGHAPIDPDKADNDTLDSALGLLRVCRQWAVSLGGIPNFYRLQSHGRLGPADGTAPHIITTPHMLRRLLLSSSGLVYYDVRACFWSVFSSLGRFLGFSTECADAYLANRNNWHTRLAGVTQCHHKVGRIKTVLLSWLSGAQLAVNPWTTAYELLGPLGAHALKEDADARQLYKEARAGLKEILKRIPRITLETHNVPVNAVGLPLRGKVERPKFGEECAHIITGYEQFAMRAMSSRVHDLRAIIYDGFIAPPQDTQVLEDHVRKESERQLGFPLHLSLKAVPFSNPIADPEKDPWDF